MTGLFDEIFFLIWVCLCVCHCKKLVTTQRLTAAKAWGKKQNVIEKKEGEGKKMPLGGQGG